MTDRRARALVFFPQVPWPARSGSRQRHVALVEALAEHGAEVIVACAEEAAVDVGYRIETFRPSPPAPPTLTERLLARVHGRRVAASHGERLDGPFFVTPAQREWARRLIEEVAPDRVVVGHAWWASLLPERLDVPTLLDTTDIVTLNRQMWQTVEASLGPERPVDPFAIVEDALDPTASLEGLQASPEEFELYDRYTVTVAINQPDAELIRANVAYTRVECGPMVMRPARSPSPPRPRGPALFMIGRNPFNQLAYAYLVRRVLPLLTRIAPDLEVVVAGSGSHDVRGCPGVTVVGEVSDVGVCYDDAALAISPVLAGTGSQIKIAEAMARGVPIVVMADAAARSSVEHDRTGLVATSAETFAEAMADLWRDPARGGAALGEAARAESARLHTAAPLSAIVGAFVQ